MHTETTPRRRTIAGRLTAAAAGTALLVGVGGAAFAAPVEPSSDVDVSVDIAQREPGELAMTVEPGEVELEESGSSADRRQFTGALPTVTVTDTRTPDQVPEGAGWYVLGSSSSLFGVDGQPSLSAGHLGWTPRLVTESESGLVAPGDQVDTVLDAGPDAVGLVDREMLAQAASSATVASEGSWSASADLFLRTPADVPAGAYIGTITLSLFE